MGFTLPSSPTIPMSDHARALMQKKSNIEEQIETQISILKANNNSTLETPLVDAEGFPRADIDVYSVRTARVRIIELRNDLEAVTNGIAKALEVIYDPALAPKDSGPGPGASTEPQPFAKVNGVAPGSPAADAGLQREDLVVKFGALGHRNFSSSSLQPLADLVAANENVRIFLLLRESGNNKKIAATYCNRGASVAAINFPEFDTASGMGRTRDAWLPSSPLFTPI
ncbi:hypothetical protein D9615_002859 [Tricholomella constricta]|uniref:Nas2 N-terminal domain-containing protein n=1 Tax=Tricholomella constricta TaxID=117010 RepID=A0A8H5M6K2_9AGAR|nr:hypothetical protein D9615_002859 [Tricholomella constricta]